MRSPLLFTLAVLYGLNFGQTPYLFATEPVKSKSYLKLKQQYDNHRNKPSDINEHLPTLKNLVLECDSVIEIGVRSMVSTWAILHGLSKNQDTSSYLGIDLVMPPLKTYKKAKELAKANEIEFDFWKVNDMHIDIPLVDLLFIDSLHTYCHLTYELETFSPKVIKYIALHDTSEPWSDMDDLDYHGDYSEYPAHINRTKRGLWPAVEDFLAAHPEWSLYRRDLNSHGFTVLKRELL